MKQGLVTGLEIFDREYARLPEGGPYPIRVVAGDKVKITHSVFDYVGPAQTLWLCWGLKEGTDFNNGAALAPMPNGVFASASFTVPECTSKTHIDHTNVNPVLTILPAMLSKVYTTFKWISTKNTSLESDMPSGTPIGHDDATVQVMTTEVTGLDVAYVKV
jgi:hypothetical protein